ncbi:putative cupredoxin [Medicago truncatula]|uniref:Plastocyanin-like domain protein n=1 Tax=Medicago truncatula TaxID=3880 RepID=A0A072TWJ3_MEDTR|nr:plastocyanin-like domain protein [Medicago truncatula]RHN38654.1 putative cupredoxin [Medicago truncatula]
MSTSMIASFFVLLLAFPYAFATDFTVGDANGWTQGVDYTKWASGKTFKVGDNLVFKYGSFHQVNEVDESGYKSCSTSNTIKSYDDGDSKVPLTKAGKIYFICPTPGHCTSTGGMKLEVNVVAASTTPTPSGTPPPTKSPSTTPSAPSETNSTTPSPPKDNGAFSVSNGVSLLMGSFFVSAMILGLMG